jgi:hypothetical protein
MSKKVKSLVLCGNARVGKDSFFECLSQYVKEHRYNLSIDEVERVSLGDICRDECRDYCWEQFGINVYDIKKKSLIRPIIVETVKIKKTIDPNYYVKLIKKDVKDIIDFGNLPICTDGRYAEEVNYFRKIGTLIVYIERYDKNAMILPPANSEEEKNNKILKSRADFVFQWPTMKNPKTRYEFATQFIKENIMIHFLKK